MWSGFTDRRLLLAAVLLCATGCAARSLDLSIALASDSCAVTLPAGGSLEYQVSTAGGGAQSLCGGCLPVTSTVTGADAIVALLRASAPACPNVAPGSSLTVSLSAFDTPGCTDPTMRIFCATSPAVTVPDGHDNAVVAVVATCDPSCGMTACKPASCASLGKDCGQVADGCGGTLACGSCSPPLKCGGAGTPNVCGK